MRKGFSVPTYAAGALMAMALLLPLVIAATAKAWEEEANLGTPLWAKVLMGLLFLGSIGYFAGMATYGHGRFGGDPVDEYFTYWFAGVVTHFVGAVWLVDTYDLGD